jgi:EmrB/QacA subfamily drug resistance transporter
MAGDPPSADRSTFLSHGGSKTSKDPAPPVVGQVGSRVDDGAACDPGRNDPRRWFGLGVVLSAAFMALLDSFIANVVAPKIRADLGTTVGQIALVVGGYVFVYGMVLPTGGRLGELYGRKRMFLVGLVLFTAASGACALAPGPGALIAARFVQAVGAGLLYPQALATLQTTFVGSERDRAFGLFGFTIGFAISAGQLIGGLLATANIAGLSWRPVFLVNVPIGLLTLAAALRWLPETRDEHPGRLDLVGAGLLMIGLSLLIYPLTMGREAGWPAWMLLAMAASPPVLAAFVLYERHRKGRSPLIDLDLFRRRDFTVGSGIALAFLASNGGLFILLAFYLQEGLGYTPLASGLMFTPIALGVTAGGLWAPRVPPRRHRASLALGYAITAAGTLALILVAGLQGPTPTATALIGPLAVIGLGQGLAVVSLLISMALRDIPDQEAGEASGLLETALEIGIALGVALITLIFYSLLGSAGASADHAAFTHAFQYTLIAIVTLALLALALLPLMRSESQAPADLENLAQETT